MGQQESISVKRRKRMTDNVFELFNLDHLSASSINKWTGDRGAWVAHYIFGVKTEVGPAAWRGRAVENGLTAYVSPSKADPLAHAMMTFERDAKGDLDDLVERERKIIAPMFEQAVIAWETAGLGQPTTQQIRIETWLEGVQIPLIGFADYSMDGYCLDLKTTKALPSSPRHDHTLQVAGYAHARREQRAALLYVTAKKHAIYELDSLQIAEALKDLARRARGLQNTLNAAWKSGGGNLSRARLRLAEMCPPNLDTFYWTDTEFAEARSRIEAWK